MNRHPYVELKIPSTMMNEDLVSLFLEWHKTTVIVISEEIFNSLPDSRYLVVKLNPKKSKSDLETMIKDASLIRRVNRKVEISRIGVVKMMDDLPKIKVSGEKVVDPKQGVTSNYYAFSGTWQFEGFLAHLQKGNQPTFNDIQNIIGEFKYFSSTYIGKVLEGLKKYNSYYEDLIKREEYSDHKWCFYYVWLCLVLLLPVG